MKIGDTVCLKSDPTAGQARIVNIFRFCSQSNGDIPLAELDRNISNCDVFYVNNLTSVQATKNEEDQTVQS